CSRSASRSGRASSVRSSAGSRRSRRTTAEVRARSPCSRSARLREPRRVLPCTCVRSSSRSDAGASARRRLKSEGSRLHERRKAHDVREETMSSALQEAPPVAPETLNEARRAVANMLSQSDSFRALDPEEREKIAGDTARIAAVLSEPHAQAQEAT